MKHLRSFLIFIATLILFLIAFNFAASELWGLPRDPTLAFLTRWVVTSETLARPGVSRGLWTAAGLLVALIWVLTVFLWQRQPRPLQLRTTSGEMLLVHPGALIKFVRLQVEGHPAVITHKVRVRQKAGRDLSVWVTAYVQPVDNLPAIKRQIEDSIRNGFSRVLGIERIEDLTIIIGLDDKTLSHRPGPAGMPEPKPEPPARSALELKPAPAHGPESATKPAESAAQPEPAPPAAPVIAIEETVYPNRSLDRQQPEPDTITPTEESGK